ncbi:DivIVA domain-containing protein [Corynebacterium pacaense]|uniref:DivIVA domain-containing protein n=1 Tax=Corynebacterium pacaense TaxID=1816684 RepID=UPI0009BB1756|nr:DivIVA domain-containing protein [Corynebacterium pacaense]
MPLTPADVHNVAFSKPPIGKRGYNEDEVDQFLDLVEDTLAQLQDENDDLRQRVEELETEAKQGSPKGSTAAPVAAGTKPGVDEAAIRREAEEKVRAEYKSKLDEATKAAEKAKAEATAARAEADKAKAEAKNAGSATTAQPVAVAAPTGAATVDTHMQAAKVLGLAQEMADRLTSEAQAESKSMLNEAREAAEKQVDEANTASSKTLEEARQRAASQVSEADARAKNLIAEAEKKSAATIADATSRAAAQVRQAEDKANALQADAERKHTETMAAVKEQQNALEIRIAELQTFEREYRTRLKTLLEGQLEELNSRGSSAPSNNTGSNNGGDSQ